MASIFCHTPLKYFLLIITITIIILQLLSTSQDQHQSKPSVFEIQNHAHPRDLYKREPKNNVTVYVSETNGTDTNPGTKELPFRSIFAAFAQASHELDTLTVILLSAYYPPANNSNLILKSDVHVVLRASVSFSSVLPIDLAVLPTIDLGNTGSFVHVLSGHSFLEIHRVQFINGGSSSSPNPYVGSIITIELGTLHLVSSRFSHANGSSMIVLFNSDTTIVDCIFEHSNIVAPTLNFDGTFIFFQSTQTDVFNFISISSSRFLFGMFQSDPDSEGRLAATAIYIVSPLPVLIKDSLFAHNSHRSLGAPDGMITIKSPSALIENCQFLNNQIVLFSDIPVSQTEDISLRGGILNLQSSQSVVTRCIFESNSLILYYPVAGQTFTSDITGGIIFTLESDEPSSFTLSDSIFDNNSIETPFSIHGGIISSYTHIFQISNCTFLRTSIFSRPVPTDPTCVPEHCKSYSAIGGLINHVPSSVSLSNLSLQHCVFSHNSYNMPVMPFPLSMASFLISSNAPLFVDHCLFTNSSIIGSEVGQLLSSAERFELYNSVLSDFSMVTQSPPNSMIGLLSVVKNVTIQNFDISGTSFGTLLDLTSRVQNITISDLIMSNIFFTGVNPFLIHSLGPIPIQATNIVMQNVFMFIPQT